jgi:hypothetical protein
MIVFDDMIQIFHLADEDSGAMLFVVALNRRGIGLTAVNGDFLGDSMAAARLREKAPGGLLIPLLVRRKSMVCPNVSTARYQ